MWQAVQVELTIETMLSNMHYVSIKTRFPPFKNVPLITGSENKEKRIILDAAALGLKNVHIY